MPAGDPTYRYLQLQTLFGVALSYADQAAFQAAGWDLTFLAAADLSALSPTWSIEPVGSDGLHRVSIAAEPTDPWIARITVPSSAYTPQLALTGLGMAYDEDSLAGLILAAVGDTGAGVVGTAAATTGRLDDWSEGDYYYRPGLVIPAWALDGIGATDLSDSVTLLAAIKDPFPTKQSADAEIAVLTATVTDVATRTIKLENAWDAALVLGSGVQRRPMRVDISVKKGTKRITSNRYDQDIVWQADTQT